MLKLLFFLVSAAAASAQTLNDYTNRIMLGGLDAGAAVLPTKPTRIGTTLPATCGVGEMYFKSDAAAGLNLYGCTATNVWTLEGDGGGGGGSITINGLTGTNFTIATGTTGTDFNITNSISTITLHLPSASASNRGALISADWSTFNAKQPGDQDLTDIAAIVGVRGDVITRGASAWQRLALGVGTRALKSDGTDAVWGQIAFGELSGSATDAQIPDTITASNYLLLTGGTLSGSLVTSNLGIEFADSDTNPGCAAGEFKVFADLSEAKLKKCENASITDLDTTGGTPAFSTLTGGTNTTAAMVVGTGASLGVSGSGTIGATSGDSATAFFGAGQIEAARGGTGIDTSASTGFPRIASGTWSVAAIADADVPDTITLTNITQITNRAIGDTTGDLAASRVDDGGVATTQALFSGAGAAAGFRAIADADIPDTITVSNYLPLIGGTLSGSLVTSNLGIEWTESDTNPTCGANDYKIYADLSENKLKKCENGSATDLDTTGGTPSFATLTGGTNVAAAMLVGTGASLAPTGSGTISANRYNGNALIATGDLATAVVIESDIGVGLAVTAGTVDFAPSEVAAVTWLDNNDRAWTFDIAGAGTSPIISFSSNTINVSTGNLQMGGSTVVVQSFTLTGGVGIAAIGDLSANRTVTFDSTELTNLTWSTGGSASLVWDFNVSGTDTQVTFGSGVVNITAGTLQQGGTAVVLATRSLTGGAGIGAIGDLSADRTIATASGETDFLASGALTCGASTQGRAQVHTTALQYCDNTGTPTLRYAAYGASSGEALAGDSATAFFSSGQIELARGGTAADLSGTGPGFLKQASLGAVVTVATLVAGDIPDLSATYQPLDADLTAVAGLSATAGFVGRTGAGAFAVRTLTGTANRITITNGDSTVGNPVFDIGTDVVTLGATQTLTAKTLTTPVIGAFTVAGLPAAGTANRVAIVTDAATVGSCTSGGGSNRAWCRDTGSAWEPLGDGGSGGGGYATIQNEGSGLTARTTVNFIGAGVDCIDNAGASKTDCTVTGGAGNASSGSFSSQTSVVITHNFGTTNVLYNCRETGGGPLFPTSETFAANTLTLGFTPAASGECRVNGGGGISGAEHPRLQTFSITSAQLTAAATTQDIALFTKVAREKICGITIKHTTAFAGTFSALTVNVSSPTGGASYYASAFDIMQTVSGTALLDADEFKAPEVSEAVNASFTSTGANLNTASAGAVEITVCRVTRP